MLLYFFLLSLGIFLIVSIVANYNARQYAKAVCLRIAAMEQIYRDFIAKKLEIEDYNPNDLRFDPEVLSKDAVNRLNPSLEGLINYINKAYLSSVRVRCRSDFFQNIAMLSSEAFSSKHKNPGKRLSTVEIERFRMALYDAVYADLLQRTLKKQDESKAQPA